LAAQPRRFVQLPDGFAIKLAVTCEFSIVVTNIAVDIGSAGIAGEKDKQQSGCCSGYGSHFAVHSADQKTECRILQVLFG
jgi:hypothetical protein